MNNKLTLLNDHILKEHLLSAYYKGNGDGSQETQDAIDGMNYVSRESKEINRVEAIIGITKQLIANMKESYERELYFAVKHKLYPTRSFRSSENKLSKEQRDKVKEHVQKILSFDPVMNYLDTLEADPDWMKEIKK